MADTKNIDGLYFVIDTNVFWINIEHIKDIPYFATMIANPDIYGKGTTVDPIKLDFNLSDMENVIEYLRNGDQYELDDSGAYVWNQLIEPHNIPTLADFVSIDVGNCTIVTTNSTLSKLNYFHALINVFKSPMPKFLDRNGKIFQLLMENLRNPTHDFPKQYNYELTFYGGYTKSSKSPVEHGLIDMQIPNITHTYAQPDKVGLYLSYNPQITLHKMVYKRYTYYESGDILVDGVQKDKIIMFDVPKENIDLITGEIYIFFSNGNKLGNILLDIIDKIELKYGNVVIASNTGKLINVLSKNLFSSMNSDECIELFFYNKYFNVLSFPNVSVTDNMKIIVTLKRDIALKSKLFLEYNKLWAPELTRFKQVNHEYLTTEWLELSYDFSNDTFEIPIVMNGCFNFIFFEIETEDYHDPLIDLTLYINSEPKKHLNTFISRRNLLHVRSTCSSPNVYAMIFDQFLNYAYHAGADPDNYHDGFQNYPSGHIQICSEDKCKIKVRLNASKGTINMYAKCFNVLRILNNDVHYGYENKLEIEKVGGVEQEKAEYI